MPMYVLNLDLMGTRVSARRKKREKEGCECTANFKKRGVFLEEMLVNTSLSKIRGNYIGEVILNLLTEAF